MKSDRLAGKVALVTGGGRGLGAAMVRVFAAAGAKVGFSYARNEEAAKALVDAVAAAGGQAFGYPVSVLDTPGTDGMMRDLESRFGPLDILVNNAGISQNLPLPLLEEEDFDKVLDVNVKGAYLTSRAALRGMMRRKKGVILNIGSLVSERILEAPIHYTTSKAAIDGLTKALAKEASRHGVRVLCLAPGLLEDGLGKNLPEHRLVDYLKHCALGRVGTLDEVAKLGCFMASDEASYMWGATVVADGGV
ncbi:MAG: SDR family oxidoreductase [Polyangiaceae bacterium]|nr:SDR family oxidoreductase [Polyangiaceae bacterium]